MLRHSHLIAIVGTFLIAVVVVAGCAGGGPGNIDERGGERGAAAANEETTAPEGDRPTAETAQKPVSLDMEVVSPGKAYVPAGFGEGSLWAINFETCEACAGPINMLLKRLDPRTGEVVAEIPLEGFASEIMEVTSGAGSVWVSNGAVYPAPAQRNPSDVVFRVDPQTNRVVDRIPVDTPCGLAFGHGSVWVTSATYGTVTRIDPQTDEVVAKIKVGRGAVDIATDENSGAVWVAGDYLPKHVVRYLPKYSEDRKLSRVDPATNRVVAQIPIGAGSQGGGAQSVAVGKGAVVAQSEDGRLFKVDPATNKVTSIVDLGSDSSHLAGFGGAVWATLWAPDYAYSEGRGEHLLQVNPRTMEVVASGDIGSGSKVGYGRLVGGGGYVWFASEDGLARVSP